MAESIVSAVVETTVNHVSKQVGYLVHYKDNINSLKARIEKLQAMKADVLYRVDEGRRNLYQITFRVEHWLSAVDDTLQEATPFLQDEIRRNINLKSRYKLSRKARKVEERVFYLLQEAMDFHALGSLSPPRVSGVKFNTTAGFQDFGSRLSIINQTLEALMDDEVSMVSICGMGGIGKTTIAKQLVKLIEERHVMDVVCMLVVSQLPDLYKIQKELADFLGLKFDGDSLNGRAEMLRSRIMQKEERILLILDDIWEVVDLTEIGIPSAGEAKGIKILLTSRKEDVCKRMGSQRNFTIPILTEEEALELFIESAFEGHPIDNQDMHALAFEIVKKCAGLPVVIIVLATALRGKPILFWENQLQQLRNSNSQNMLDIVYPRLQLSYDYLPSEESKSCFLLCCLFPIESSILIEDLVRYGMRLGLFGNTDNFLQVREKVDMLIDGLKGSFFLLDGDTGDSVRMHDILHEFAISIASKEKSYVCCYDGRRNLLNTDTLRSCKAMSLAWEETNECPVVWQCPNLEFLLFVSRRSSESVNFFFRGLITGELGNLVVLAIKTQNSPKLPEEIGLLTNLRMLDLGGMSGLKYVPQGVLSKLSKLEELYVTPEFRRWGSGVEGEDGERINASLTELEFLPIIALQISTPKASVLPKLPFFKNLVQCEIRLGNTLLSKGKKLNNELVLEGDASDVKGSGICALLKKTEQLRLERVENVKSIIEHLIDYTKQIPSSPDTQLQYFHNLRYLAIEFCGDLKHVFPLSIARTLSRLEKIRINDCIKMEGILYGKGEVDAVEFPCLTNLELIGVPNLNGFWVDIDNAGAGLLPNQSSDEDAAMKPSTSYWKGTSSSMEQPSTSEIEMESSLVAEIGRVELNFILFPSWIRLSTLEELRLQGCRLLRVAFPSTVAEQLVKLRTLDIRWCCKMEYIVAIVGGPQEKDSRSSMPVFPKLTSFIVDDLPELMAFAADSHIYLERISLDELKVSKCPKIQTLFETLPPDYDTRQDELRVSTNEILFKIPPQLKGSINVKLLEVRLCDNLTHLFSSRVAKFLMGLERLEIRYCEKMKEIIGKEEEEKEDACDLLSLESVTIDGCFQLKTFSYKNSFSTPNLKEIHVNGSQYPLVEDLNTTIEKVMLSKSCIFNMKQLVRIGRDQIPDGDSSKIRDLEIQGCDKLLNAIPCNLIVRLQKLEKLAVRWCDSLEEIFEYKGAMKFEGESVVTFSHLEEITLFGLENLKHVFTSIPKTIIGFQKLRKLYVHNCHSLRNIFSVSSARGLLQLQELKVSSCDGLKEIVAKDDKEEQASRDRIVFPQLRSIHVSDSATLECFYSGIYDLVMPLLESLHLNQCPSIKNFSNGLFITPKLQKLQGDCKETLLISTSLIGGDLDEIIANKKKRIQIRIYNRNDLQKIGHDQLPFEDLSQIQDLEIQACAELLCAIPCNLIASDLQKLEKLVVRRCHLLEEIFEQGGATFGSGSITTFSNLEEITLFDLEKLQHVFYDIPSATIHFQKLRKLHIHGCYTLRNVFSVSSVKGLSQLQELKLSSCDGLEEIVAQGEKEAQAIKDKIVFPQLRSIDIGYSSKLVCFYSGIYALEFPLLQSLFLYECPRMSTFSNGLLATPNLPKVQIDNANYQLLEDLNVTMKYKAFLVRRDENSQGLDERQRDSEFALGSSAQMYNNTDASSSSAAHIAALQQEIQMLNQRLASMQQMIANVQH